MKVLRLLAWLLTGVAALAFLTLPVSVATQLALSLSVIVVMTAIWRFGRGRLARWAFLALGTFVVLRYMDWRLTSTLPPVDQPINFALGLLLVAAELYCMLILTISLIINADPLERPALERGDDVDLPSVDVFIPTYNEDALILATTLAAAKSLDYPKEKLTVWLLDDGGTDQKCDDLDSTKAAAARARRLALQELCGSLGARYLTRARNEHAKAGNLNNGLRHSKAAIVVVFDADHAPFRSFLRETIGHFAKDAKLFLVQTPHVFLNPDPIERNLRTFDRMPSENEMFYSVTQRGLDKWNGSFFCGSAALLRRQALDEVGGFSGVTVTEDCETAFELHAKGWTSVYVDKPLIAGLQPETFASFVGQRSRWCQGMFQILLMKNPLFKKGLAPIQRLAYLSSMTFWFFPLPRLAFTIAPLLHIFFDVKIFVSSMDEAVAYSATYMVVNLMLQNYLYGRVRWPFVSELYEYVQGVYLCKTILGVVVSPRSPSFNVTSKGISLEKDHLSDLAWPFFAIFGLLAIGAVTAFYRYAFEPGAELMLIVGLWTTFNLIVAGAALGVVSERREPDRFPRLPIARTGFVTASDPRKGPPAGPGGGGGRRIPVGIHSVSAGGCSLRVAPGEPALAGGRFALHVAALDAGKVNAPMTIDFIHATAAKDETTFGFTFVDLTPDQHMALADLMYGDPGAMLRFLSKRRSHMNLFRGIGRFAAWGLLEPFRAFSYAAKLVPLSVTKALPSLASAPLASSEAQSLATTAPAMLAISEPLATTRSEAPAFVASVDVVVVETATDLSQDFDALAALFDDKADEAVPLLGRVDPDPVVIPSDWMHALLTMAAQEMRRSETAETIAPAASVAAA